MLEGLLDLFPGMSLRPALACEISPYGVLAARQHTSVGLATQFVPLRAGAVLPGLAAPNIPDRSAVIAALRTALHAVTDRKRRTLAADRALTLIVPDGALRVLLLDFDALPSKRVEALAILRFRLRRLVPFEVEDAAISWQIMSTGAEGVRVLTVVMPRTVLLEYEGLVREAGFIPGVVLPSTVAATPLVGLEPTLLVNHNGATLTTAITRGQELLLHRTLDFRGAEAGAEIAQLPADTRHSEESEADDVRKSVSVALAYFEDTLSTLPAELFYIGPGSAEHFSTLLGEPSLAVRNLGDEAELPSRTVPRSLLAPVTGALLNA